MNWSKNNFGSKGKKTLKRGNITMGKKSSLGNAHQSYSIMNGIPLNCANGNFRKSWASAIFLSVTTVKPVSLTNFFYQTTTYSSLLSSSITLAPKQDVHNRILNWSPCLIVFHITKVMIFRLPHITKCFSHGKGREPQYMLDSYKVWGMKLRKNWRVFHFSFCFTCLEVIDLHQVVTSKSNRVYTCL